MVDTLNPSPVAHGYPTQPVRVVEPFGAGGGVDVLARALSQTLSALWGQPVTVTNHPGAGSTAAPALVATAPADGYTVLIHTSAQAYSAALLTQLPYDPVQDFSPVAPLTTQPYVLVASPAAGITTIRELVAAATARPRALTFGSAGIGTGTHLGVEQFNLDAGISAVHVPAHGGDAITDAIARTVAGQTTYMLAPIPSVLSTLHAGRLQALGVSTTRRSPLLPAAPTIAEAGVAGFAFPIWYGVWVPAGTPAVVVETLATDIARALATPDLTAWLARHGAEPLRMMPPAWARFVRRESARAAHIMKAATIRAQEG